MNERRIIPERVVQPTQPRPAPPAVPSRPTWVDYFLLLFGCALSLLLTDLSGFQAEATDATPRWVASLLLRSLPHMLFLPLGILLLWPLFYLTQRIAGRSQSITSGEWLWGVAWLGTLILVIWIAWQAWGTSPEYLASTAFKTFKGHVFVGYAITILALAVVALVTGLFDLFGRWGRPWTHPFVLALLMWPVLPLLALLMWKIKME